MTEVTEEMMRRAHEANAIRDYKESDHDHLRKIIHAAINVPEVPLIEVTPEMERAGREAYKFSMWRSLCYAATIEETLAYIYRSMAAKDPARAQVDPAPDLMFNGVPVYFDRNEGQV